MCRTVSPLVVSAGMLLSTLPVCAVTVDTVPVGNAGNANDSTGLGAVGYDYRIGTTEVTVGQYTDFLNAVAATDTYGLYSPFMASNAIIGGIIAQSGSPGSYSYSVIGSPNWPVVYVDLGDAYRFANWLHNGQPTGGQNASTTEDGAYLLNGATNDTGLSGVSRLAGAKWFLPTESEWYKAAYHKNDGVSGNYFDYPTASNTAPSAGPPPGGANSANYAGVVGGLTDVGAYTGSPSAYDTFDQGGNVWEWYEGLLSSDGLPGGSWTGPASQLMAGNVVPFVTPTTEDFAIGIRVATVPEPSTLALAALAAGALLSVGCRRRKH